MLNKLKTLTAAGALALALITPISGPIFAADLAFQSTVSQSVYHSEKIGGVNIAYREAGDPSKPTVLLLHGFPTSSHMFRNLIPELAKNITSSPLITQVSAHPTCRKQRTLNTPSKISPTSLPSFWTIKRSTVTPSI